MSSLNVMNAPIANGRPTDGWQVVGTYTEYGAGAGTGAWFGLFIGLLVGLFTTGPVWAGLVLGGLLIGAMWGAAFGFFAHWATHGQRDFASAHTLIAERYDVLVPDAHAKRAQLLLTEAR
jgi:hypothetical protein